MRKSSPVRDNVLVLLKSGYRQMEISRKLNKSSSQISQIVSRLVADGKITKDEFYNNQHKQGSKRAKMLQAQPLLQFGMTVSEVADQMGVSKSQIARYLQEFRRDGVDIGKYSTNKSKILRNRSGIHDVKIIELADQMYTISEIGRILDINRGGVRLIRDRIKEKTGKVIKFYTRPERNLHYVREGVKLGLSRQDIATKYGLHYSIVSRVVGKHSLKNICSPN